MVSSTPITKIFEDLITLWGNTVQIKKRASGSFFNLIQLFVSVSYIFHSGVCEHMYFKYQVVPEPHHSFVYNVHIFSELVKNTPKGYQEARASHAHTHNLRLYIFHVWLQVFLEKQKISSVQIHYTILGLLGIQVECHPLQ